MDQFVCLRMVRMRDVDLSLFQFDYDLTWAGLMMESDGTVLGRYGAGSKNPMHYNSLKGLRKAMERVLKLHGDLGSNKADLALKNATQVTHKHPRDLPNADIKKILENETQKKNCIHCHMVQEGLNRVIEKKSDYHPDQIRSLYPVPERLGVVLDVDDGLMVARILPNSHASKAGLMRGDEITKVQGQPLISPADMIWALRSVPDPGTVKIEFLREEKPIVVSIPMPAKWKVSDISWRASMYGLFPRLKVWVEKAPKSKRRKAKVEDEDLALEVLGVFGDEGRKAGIKKGDIVVGVGSWHPNVGAEEFNQYIRVHYYKSGSKIPLTIKRGKQTLELSMQF